MYIKYFVHHFVVFPFPFLFLASLLFSDSFDVVSAGPIFRTSSWFNGLWLLLRYLNLIPMPVGGFVC